MGTGEDFYQQFLDLREKLVSDYSDVEAGPMMSSPGIRF
jgi:hypothetical protein